MDKKLCPRKILSVTCEGRRNRCRTFRTTRDSFVEGLRLVIDDIYHRGNLNDWLKHALDKSSWNRILKKIILVEHSDFNCRDYDYDNVNENRFNNVDINNNRKNLRINTSTHVNDDVDDK